MNMSPIATDVAAQMVEVVNYILSLKISPSDKRRRLARAFKLVGVEFYGKTFADASEIFDSTAIGADGFPLPDSQVDALASKMVQNYNLGRTTNPVIVKEYFDTVLGKAQSESFANGRSLGKVPTLTRKLVGETCEWCTARVGTFTYPEGELFARHDYCDCMLIVDGYNSRNGILTNYKKIKEKS